MPATTVSAKCFNYLAFYWLLIECPNWPNNVGFNEQEKVLNKMEEKVLKNVPHGICCKLCLCEARFSEPSKKA